MLPHPVTNFEMQKYYQNEPRFKGVYSGNYLPKVKRGVNVINLDEYKSIGTLWEALYVSSDDLTYFDSFWVKYISKDIRKFIDNKNSIINIYRIQANDSKMCGYFCIGFIDFMRKGRILIDYINLLSPTKCEKNEKIILKYFNN